MSYTRGEPEDRRELLEQEDAYFDGLAKNAAMHLERAMKARMRLRTYDALADHYYAMGRVEAILKEFGQAAYPVPDFVMEGWQREIQQMREAA